MAKLNIIEAVNNALDFELSKDKSVVVLGEDVGVDGGVFRATEGLLKKYGPSRVFDTPLSESGIIGASIGMAVYGLRPVAEIQFTGFVYLAFNQLVAHAAKIRTRTRGRYTVPLVLRTPHGGGFRALEHHGESMEAYYLHTAGLKVVMPSTPSDTKGLLISAIRDPDPVIFLEPTRLYRAIKEEVPEGGHTVPIGKARIVKKGNDATIITYGTMVRPCMQAAEVMAEKGREIEVIDLRTLSPLDEEAVLNSVKETGRAVVVHEAPKNCGLGAEISALIGEKILFSLKAPVLRVAAYDVPYPFFMNENNYIPNEKKIISALNKVMAY